jgi:hypothetical protein
MTRLYKLFEIVIFNERKQMHSSNNIKSTQVNGEKEDSINNQVNTSKWGERRFH